MKTAENLHFWQAAPPGETMADDERNTVLYLIVFVSCWLVKY